MTGIWWLGTRGFEWIKKTRNPPTQVPRLKRVNAADLRWGLTGPVLNHPFPGPYQTNSVPTLCGTTARTSCLERTSACHRRRQVVLSLPRKDSQVE